MLIGTENSHYRKYLTTLGVSLIAGSVSLCGLFLQLQADLLVEQAKINALTPVAQQVIRQRQQYLQWASLVLPYVLGSICATGLVMACFGLRGWSLRQKISDRKEEMEGKKLEVEIRQLTAGESEQRISDEAKAALGQHRPSSPRTIVIKPSEELLRRSEDRDLTHTFEDTRNRIREIEMHVSRLAKDVFGEERVQPQVVINGSIRRYADLIVIPSEVQPGYVFEIKYVGASLERNLANRVTDGLLQVATIANGLALAGQGEFVPVFLLIFDEKDYCAIHRRLSVEVDTVGRALSLSPLVIAVGRATLREWSPAELRAALQGSDLA